MADKKIVFYEDDAVHAKLRIQLKYHNVRQKDFFKIIISSFLDQDPYFMEFFNKKMEPLRSKKVIKNLKKDAEERKKNEENFALNEDEIKNIFDIIESENPDI